jgi:hypothetical protein
MKLSTTIMMIFFCSLIVGCNDSTQTTQDMHPINTELINTYNDMAVQNALVSQHTLFPYHFVKNGAELNELGERDLDILAKRFVEHTGQLNIRRGNTPADLYAARTNVVIDRLQKAGVDTERMSISDGMPGGSGMASERILVILESANDGASARTSTTYESTTRR